MPPMATTAVEWSKLDIRRLPTLVKEVDALVKFAPGYKETFSDDQMHDFLVSLDTRIDEVDSMKREFADDPRVIVVDRQLFRLRQVRVELRNTPVGTRNNHLHESKPAKEATEPKQEVKPMYNWETRSTAWHQSVANKGKHGPDCSLLRHTKCQRLMTADLNYIALKEPGHFSTRSPVENTLEVEGQFEFQIIMTEQEWRWHQKQRRQIAAETKHLERKKKAEVHGAAPQQRSIQSSTPYIDPLKLEKSVYR
ncbi:hypothetical protein H310_00035 [Aphanomyces invadans]|uniref:Uncharacterized protein n=1 Tax=Aphanomyces invadans TaxID=157072 RepID=A0A024UU20_9STRA|nr:hypothetical protein H310_00035 [Aphanomyces invadans]ETW09430.1 hypothetical protein H310_00035 [Aphanomyces invadans]|eukprot:XP_008860841.1 hypothetical protein H310_00035 [Aphanomyces invadans]